MAFNNEQTSRPINPNSDDKKSEDLLPRYFKTLPNKKFLSATIDQMISKGSVEKISGYVGRRSAKAAVADDVYIGDVSKDREDYQLEPSIVIKDNFNNLKFYGNYLDIINSLKFYGNTASNHSKVFEQEYYAWDPHIDWDKFVNFREYYWLPNGPEPVRILGNSRDIVSTYTVTISDEGDNVAYVFSPDGLTRNPVLKLYRGQTYRFVIDAAGSPFYIKNSRAISADDLYEIGIENNGVEAGILTFTVPSEAPETLYYVSGSSLDTAGIIKVDNIEENTFINVESEIIGKRTFTLTNGTELSNGMRLYFEGDVIPSKYSTGYWYVEGVGESIHLIPEKELEIIAPYLSDYNIPFDSDQFDNYGFEVSNSYPATKEYLTINRASLDRNPWSRSNRWFHSSVIETSARLRNIEPVFDSNARAKRPIIEFEPNLKLFNSGSFAKKSVDLVDDFTDDIFTKIEGKAGYNVDGVQLFNGMRVLFVADNDILVKGKIYEVRFITYQSRRQISLVETADSIPQENDCVLVRQGRIYQGTMWHVENGKWVESQNKISLNQAPLFDLFDSNEHSIGNPLYYPASTFKGNKLFSYKVGSGSIDTELGFPLTYQNINNIGDISFDVNLATDVYEYKAFTDENISSVSSKKCFLKQANRFRLYDYVNSWVKASNKSRQAVVSEFIVEEPSNFFPIDVFENSGQLLDLVVRVSVNGVKKSLLEYNLYRENSVAYIRFFSELKSGDVVKIKSYSRVDKLSSGHYEIPINFQNNPKNLDISSLTLGQITDHVDTIVENSTQFFGAFPGNSNLRDIGLVSKFGTRFVQHSSALLGIGYHLLNSESNVISSILKASNEYSKFKKNILLTYNKLGLEADPKLVLDEILSRMTLDMNPDESYKFSDMLGFKNFTSVTHQIIDQDLTQFALSSIFNLKDLSSRAVGVYLNGNQLLHGLDYEFTEEGFVNVIKLVQEGDIVEIREYRSTDGTFCPPTPTKLGLYPLFAPKIFIDTTYSNPTLVIQGHDGSITVAYNDSRDDILLEFESRIYNNCKQRYDQSIFNIHDYIPGYQRQTGIGRKEFDDVLKGDFLKWTQYIDKDFTRSELFYQEGDHFSYNYGKCLGPSQGKLPGFWRGIYRWVFDTDSPHLTPWECLGFSVQPKWWEQVYGPAPYTKDNLILWQDLEDGLVREPGKLPIKRSLYARPNLTRFIPTTQLGELEDPLTAGIAQNFSLLDANDTYKFGDINPVESAWRRSSYYPFSVIKSILTLRPALFDMLYDLSRITRSLAGQLVYTTTGLRFNFTDIVHSTTRFDSTRVYTSGLIDWIYGNLNQKNSNQVSNYRLNLASLDASLSFKLAGFSTKEKLKVLLDSRTPNTKGSIYIPDENYDLYTVKSAPTQSINYSAVVVEKMAESNWNDQRLYQSNDVIVYKGLTYVSLQTNQGKDPISYSTIWRRFDKKEVAKISYLVRGYDKSNNVFYYHQPLDSNKDPVLEVAATSEDFVVWSAAKFYAAGVILYYDGKYFKVLKDFTSGPSFSEENLSVLPRLPVTGGVRAVKKTKFDRSEIKEVPYGTTFTRLQDLVNFLYGYGDYLVSQGFRFDFFNKDLETVTNWDYAVTEVMFWSSQGWAPGSAISVSPAADEVRFKKENVYVDNQLDKYYDYTIYKSDGNPIDFDLVNYLRDSNEYLVRPRNIDDGIFNITLNLVQSEQVVIFDDRTVFNDVIYDKAGGYRQERVKVVGYRTTPWDGTFNVPGFVYDDIEVVLWSAWTDYVVGQIVSYQDFYYSAKKSIPGSSEFNTEDWTRLDKLPEGKFIPNWDYKAQQFLDFYDLETSNFDTQQQNLAKHLIGYQDRSWLAEIIPDPISQYKFYQGYVTEKGSFNSLSKLFDKLTGIDDSGIKFYEEFALRLGSYGAIDGLNQVEYILEESKFKLNPQPVELTDAVSTLNDLVIRIPTIDTYSYDEPYNHAPFPLVSSKKNFVKTAGYVDPNDAKFIVKTIDDVIGMDISQWTTGDYVWCTFEKQDWNVYRFQIVTNNVVTIDRDADGVYIEFSSIVPQTLTTGKILGLNFASTELNTFHKITKSSVNRLYISTTVDILPIFNDSSLFVVYEFVPVRLKDQSFDSFDPAKIKNFKSGELVWADTSLDNKWQVYKNNPVYSSSLIVDNENAQGDDSQFPHSISVTADRRTMAVGNPFSENAYVYERNSINNIFSQEHDFSAPILLNENSKFGNSVSISRDREWLVIGAPEASNLKTRFKGQFSKTIPYNRGDIVRYKNSYWQVRNQLGTLGDGSTFESQMIDWNQMPHLPIDSNGDEYPSDKQGAIAIYKRETIQYVLHSLITEPSPYNNQRFGTKVKIVSAGNDYRLFVSAPGFNNNQGRVYIYQYEEHGDSTDGWNQFYNKKYKGIYDRSYSYRSGDIVSYNDSLWLAINDSNYADSALHEQIIFENDPNWVEYYDNDYLYFRPHNFSDITIAADSSTSNDRYSDSTIGNYGNIENVRSGDYFGHDFDVSSDGAVMIVSAPYADDSYYENFRGAYRSLQNYYINDVVRFHGKYYRSKISQPALGGFNPDNWDVLATAIYGSGKVFVYNFEGNGYVYTQELSAGTVEAVGDSIGEDNLFGYSVSISDNGGRVAVGSPMHDFSNYVNPGSVYIFKHQPNVVSYNNYDYESIVKSNDSNDNDQFGFRCWLNETGDQLVVDNRYGKYRDTMSFDSGTTTFDQRTTNFISQIEGKSRISIYDRYQTKFIYGEDLRLNYFENYKNFTDLALVSNSVFVGYPGKDSTVKGEVHVYNRPADIRSWTLDKEERDRVNISKFKNIFLFDKKKNKITTYLDWVDVIQGRIPGIAEQELAFKTPYDPAVYSNGTSSVVLDEDTAWSDEQVGMLWWDLSTTKFLDPYQQNLLYQTSTWNKLAHGASIDIYEWVKSRYLPDDWNDLADTETGLTEGISGKTKYDNQVYTVKYQYDTISETLFPTYYFWVKNRSVVPNKEGRSISANDVSRLINDPKSQGYEYAILLDDNKFALSNIAKYLNDSEIGINFRYWSLDKTDNNIHNHYQIISENSIATVINEEIVNKWFDSLIGFDANRRNVPDIRLNSTKAYGILNKPRQGMFINRREALNQFITNVNSILKKQIIVDDFDLSGFLYKDDLPLRSTGLWDYQLDNKAELDALSTYGFRNARISAQVKNGKISDVTVIDLGQGYTEYVGLNPKIEVTSTGIDFVYQWKDNNVEIVNPGVRYPMDSTTVSVRPISVLVRNDETIGGIWSIYRWNDSKRSWDRYSNQLYDVTRYWDYSDWYADGYNQFVVPDYTYDFVYELPKRDYRVGDIIRINNNGSSGWVLLEQVGLDSQADFDQSFRIIGRQSGTIQLSDLLINYGESAVGFGNVFDSINFDNYPDKELRIILTSLRENILIRELEPEFNKLFFYSLKYILSEQPYVDWIMKTSLVSVLHNINMLSQRTNFKSDPIDSYIEYAKEVKPYKTKIREFVTAYNHVEGTRTLTTDFDLPSYYDTVSGEIKTLSVKVKDNSLDYSTTKFEEQPYYSWLSTVGYEVIRVEFLDRGQGYITAPIVELDGQAIDPAELKAYIGLGKVSYLEIVRLGSGYLTPPTITFNGGLKENGRSAKAIAIIGNGLARSIYQAIKYDRIGSEYNISAYENSTTYALGQFVEYEGSIYKSLIINNVFAPNDSRFWTKVVSGEALYVSKTLTNLNGSQFTFDLEYPLDTAKRFITIQSNTAGTIYDYLEDDFSASNILDSSVTAYSRHYGQVVLNDPPSQGSTLTIVYRKNINLLDAANRILHYYNPLDGQPGKELYQVMSGIDYGGVEVTGVGFDTSAGYEVIPWDMGPWDLFDSEFTDHIVISDGTTREFTLPFIPGIGEMINVYRKSILDGADAKFVRIDDPYFDLYDGVSIQPNGRLTAPLSALMNTVISPGSSTVNIPENVNLEAGDYLIFRRSTSDGTYTPNASSFDSIILGGDLSYGNASGIKPDDINVDGDNFVTPDTSYAPEENVPGQLFDNVSISVYTLNRDRAPLIISKNYLTDGVTTEFAIGQLPCTNNGVIVKLDNLILNPTQYAIDYETLNIVFETAYPAFQRLNITSMSQAGNGLIEVDHFISDGSTTQYVTRTPASGIYTLVVLSNGQTVTVEQFVTDNTYDQEGYLGFELSEPLEIGSVIQYNVCFGEVNLLSIIETEEVVIESISETELKTSYALLNRPLIKGPWTSQTIIEHNGSVLKGEVTYHFDVIGTNRRFTLPTTDFNLGLLPGEVDVYVNGVLLTLGTQYRWLGGSNTARLRLTAATPGDVVTVSVKKYAEYSIHYNTDLSTEAVAILDILKPVANGDKLYVTTFSVHDVLGLKRYLRQLAAPSSFVPLSTKYYDKAAMLGGRILLPARGFQTKYVWLIQNGSLLTPEIDYVLEDNLEYLRIDSSVSIDDNDQFEVLMFNNYAPYPGYAFRITKDILNRNIYTRVSNQFSAELSVSLYPLDVEISFVDASKLPDPGNSGVPGVLEINHERIEYFRKVGNTVSQLRRGTLGTGVADVHNAGSIAYEQGSQQLIPYKDDTQTVFLDFGDGTTSIFALDFVPKVNPRTLVSSWYRDMIPENYGQCDEIEVFVGGRRLRKTPIEIFDPTLAQDSPAGDKQYEAEYSVNGVDAIIRFTEPPADGQKIEIIKKSGMMWSSWGTPLVDGDNMISNFLTSSSGFFNE